MKDYKKYKEINNQFFDKLISNSGDEHTSVGQSKLSHMKRMQVMLNIGDLDQKKLLDVGCGLGSFYDFLRAEGKQVNYTGFDINEMMLQNARTKHPGMADKFKKIDIIEEQLNESYDYILSIGPLNLNLSESINYDMTYKLLDNMYKNADIGMALSMTSIMSQRKNEDTFYYDPVKIIGHISQYCNNYRLDHSYLPHDFTIFCYKDDFYSSFK